MDSLAIFYLCLVQRLSIMGKWECWYLARWCWSTTATVVSGDCAWGMQIPWIGFFSVVSIFITFCHHKIPYCCILFRHRVTGICSFTSYFSVFINFVALRPCYKYQPNFARNFYVILLPLSEYSKLHPKALRMNTTI